MLDNVLAKFLRSHNRDQNPRKSEHQTNLTLDMLLHRPDTDIRKEESSTCLAALKANLGTHASC